LSPTLISQTTPATIAAGRITRTTLTIAVMITIPATIKANNASQPMMPDGRKKTVLETYR